MTTEHEDKLIDTLQDLAQEHGYGAVVRTVAGMVSAEALIAGDVAADLDDGDTSCARALAGAASLLRLAASRIRASGVDAIRGMGVEETG